MRDRRKAIANTRIYFEVRTTCSMSPSSAQWRIFTRIDLARSFGAATPTNSLKNSLGPASLLLVPARTQRTRKSLTRCHTTYNRAYKFTRGRNLYDFLNTRKLWSSFRSQMRTNNLYNQIGVDEALEIVSVREAWKDWIERSKLETKEDLEFGSNLSSFEFLLKISWKYWSKILAKVLRVYLQCPYSKRTQIAIRDPKYLL